LIILLPAHSVQSGRNAEQCEGFAARAKGGTASRLENMIIKKE
jgi:hypothetical protein